ncbi:hypothetical protein GCM10020219_033170 [Nonomuraea dietziae]
MRPLKRRGAGAQLLTYTSRDLDELLPHVAGAAAEVLLTHKPDLLHHLTSPSLFGSHPKPVQIRSCRVERQARGADLHSELRRGSRDRWTVRCEALLQPIRAFYSGR